MDELNRIGALQHERGTSTSALATSIVPVLPGSQFIFRGRSAAITIAGEAFGFPFPQKACRAEEKGGRAALWLGPDEFLLLAPLTHSTPIQTELSMALRDTPHALVDVGHRHTALQISGPNATALMNAGCPLDLHETVFPIAACTRTILAKAQIMLWRTAPDVFYLNTWRSFAAYVWAFLAEADRGCP